jgi:4'-phosphopantetheinyl transferase
MHMTTLHLPTDELHIWRARLTPSADAGRAARTLSADERARASRYAVERTRLRYVMSRSILRMLLGAYLGVDAEAVRFEYGAYGKPSLDPSHETDIAFNLSHSGPVAVFAFARGTQIGVDIEQMHARMGADAVVERFFSTREREIYRSLPESQRPRAFLCGWTRKEAYLKARGMGLSASPSDVEVTLLPGEPARLLGAVDEGDSHWQLDDIAAGDDWVGALATGRGARRVKNRYWAADLARTLSPRMDA